MRTLGPGNAFPARETTTNDSQILDGTHTSVPCIDCGADGRMLSARAQQQEEFGYAKELRTADANEELLAYYSVEKRN